jgi:DNA-binding response OmpR family regulator
VALKILDVDDDQDVLEARKMVLEHDGFEVIQTTNIDVARETVENESIDLIILDVMMQKDSDGFNFAQHVKLNEKLKHIPIIMVTAVSQRTPFKFNPETDGAFLPVEKFLEKPVDPDLLIATVRGLIKK